MRLKRDAELLRPALEVRHEVAQIRVLKSVFAHGREVRILVETRPSR